MGTEWFSLLGTIITIMVGMRLLFGELDSRMAIKRLDLKYFLDFEQRYVYKNMKSTVLLMLFCFLMFGGISLFSGYGLLLLALFVAMGVVIDIVSGWIFHFYGRFRFKKRIEEAKNVVSRLKKEIERPFDPEEIVEQSDGFDFTEVVDRYVKAEDHMACFSRDGGAFMEKMKHYSQVTFLVDEKLDAAKKRFADTMVRVTGMTSDQRYPFKDGRLDLLVCYNTNFKPEEVGRVLKEDGIFIAHQLGSENMQELTAMTSPFQIRNVWNMQVLSESLRKLNYLLLDRHESRSEMRFLTLGAFVHYLKANSKVNFDHIENYANALNVISQLIQTKGYFAVKTHHFYVVARKRSQSL